MSSYAVGDIHGCGRELTGLLDQIGFTDTDTLYPVGDLFDRALDAPTVWDICQRPNVFPVIGNHEVKMHQFLTGQRPDVPHHYRVAIELLREHGVRKVDLVNFLENLPRMRVIRTASNQEVIIVHAGVNPQMPWEDNKSWNVYGKASPKASDAQLAWVEPYSLREAVPLVVYGHVVCEKNLPCVHKNSIGIDTAACHGGPLTAYNVCQGTFHQFASGRDWFTEVKKVRL